MSEPMTKDNVVGQMLEGYRKFRARYPVNPSRLTLSWNSYITLATAPREERNRMCIWGTNPDFPIQFNGIPLAIDPFIGDGIYYFGVDN